MALVLNRLPVSRIVVQLLQKQLSQLQRNNTVHTSPHKQKSIKSWYQSLWIPRKTEPPYTHITQIGDPVLRQKADLVPLDAIKSKELNLFIDQLTDVLRNYKLAGIAAPQVGISLRLIIMEFSDRLREEFPTDVYKSREMETLPLTVSILLTILH